MNAKTCSRDCTCGTFPEEAIQKTLAWIEQGLRIEIDRIRQDPGPLGMKARVKIHLTLHNETPELCADCPQCTDEVTPDGITFTQYCIADHHHEVEDSRK